MDVNRDVMAGVDWKAMFSSLPAYGTANALALALSPIAGGMPRVVNGGGYYEIDFTPEQEDRVSAWILLQLNKEPGPVRVDAGNIAWTVVSRKYWPYALGAVALGAFLGYSLKR